MEKIGKKFTLSKFVSVMTKIDNSNLRESLYELVIELNRAELNHPEWPEDVFHQASVLSEEVGEVHKTLLDWKYFDKATKKDVENELIQTGAMVLRMLKNLRKR